MSTLELSNVSKSFGPVEALKGIDLALGSGEFLVLLGASGCGKSTLLSLISGLSDPSGGDVTLDGRRLNGVHPKDRDIAMVFQSYALYPNLTVARNIGFGLEMRGVAKAERKAAVAEAAKTLADRPPARPQARRAVRGSATARRDRPRAGAQAEAVPL